jgi:hypothetical protein
MLHVGIFWFLQPLLRMAHSFWCVWQRLEIFLVGNPAACLSTCAAQSASPNNNAGADAMVSVIARELVELISDPDINAWYDGVGSENADKCGWTLRPTGF